MPGAGAVPLEGGGSDGAGVGGDVGGTGAGRQVLRRLFPYLGVAPFLVYTFVFLGLPAIAIGIGAFRNPNGGATFSNISIATHGIYWSGYRTSIELSLLTSIVPGILGFIVAYAIHVGRSEALRRMVATISGVFANFGGLPLAFLFIASISARGLITTWLNDIHLDPYNHGFSLTSFSGVAIVYMYFQVPLMVLLITPALGGIKPAWREAAGNLGARSWQFWRYVGAPVLFPSFLGAVLLLFGSALSAYATAEVLTAGSLPITPLQIAGFLDGNVQAGQENVGYALGLGLILIVLVVIVLYVLIQRRASKWLQ